MANTLVQVSVRDEAGRGSGRAWRRAGRQTVYGAMVAVVAAGVCLSCGFLFVRGVRACVEPP